MPHAVSGALDAVVLDANTDSFLESFFEPQFGHSVPSQCVERTRISLSRLHLLQ
jgi:hypothetical protein